MKKGFTLAEVLITLGVIGVVAAITIPTVVKNYQKYRTVNRLKATYTILNNALEMAKVDYGTDVNSWSMPDTTSAKELSAYFAQQYMIPYLKVVKDCDQTETTAECNFAVRYLNGELQNTDSWIIKSKKFTLANGSAVSVYTMHDNDEPVRVTMYIYINGFNANNVIGKDVFLVELGGGGADKDFNKFLPYGLTKTISRETLLGINDSDINRCSKEKSGMSCLALIVKDGWKIAPDYPW